MDALSEEIKKINPIFSVKYKGVIDRFLSLTLIERIFIGIIFLSIFGFLYLAFISLNNEDKFVILLSSLITLIVAGFIFFHKIGKNFQFKIILGKDSFMVFKYSSRNSSYMHNKNLYYIFYTVLKYSDIKSYIVKNKAILIEIDIDKFQEDALVKPWYYIGNLTKDEIKTIKRILQEHKVREA